MAEDAKKDNEEYNMDKDFSNKEKETHKTFEMIKELLISTTEKEIELLGYEKNDKIAGVYGDGTTYGSGVDDNKYSVIVSSKPRKFSNSKDMNHGFGNGSFEKQIFIGAKRMESQIDFEIKGQTLNVQYRSPEASFFRGVDSEGGTFMIRKKITIPLKDSEKELKKEFIEAAKKEVGYLTNTKLGVEDRFEKSTTSIVENLNMKKLTLKSLFQDDLDFSKQNINEEFDSLPKEEEENIKAVKDLNTLPLNDSEEEKFMLFDDKEMRLEELIKELNIEEDEDFIKKLSDEYGVQNGKVSDLTDAEKVDFFNSLKKETIEEITMSGPSVGGVQVGAGGYLGKLRKAMTRSFKSVKPKIGAPYTEPVNHPIYEDETLSESTLKKSFNKTSYAKSKYSRPKVDKNYNIISEQKSTNSSKPYTQVVKVDPNYHPQGMPFVEPNSEEELEKTNNDYDKMKRMGLNETNSEKNERLRKRKFLSINENKTKGINKRYIVTEKVSSEFEKERWKKLSLFDKSETIKEAEEMSSVLDNIEEYNEFYSNPKSLVKESFENTVKKENKSDEIETIEVEKPNSSFGITQKFYKEDFLNESKLFILDLNSKVYVPNPNRK